jgi:1-acyl-sn-glycerol-3-phosphate acyltransferase
VFGELADWLARADSLLPAEDRRVLLCPPRLITRFARFAMRRASGRAGGATADDITARDPVLVSWLLDFWRVVARNYFRLRIEGIDHVPARGPVLLVGNHCGGLVPSEGFSTTLAVHDRFGAQRAVYALAHDFLFEDPILRRTMTRLGMMRAGHESAAHAFAADACVLVYPGSDMETFRPFRDRNKIVLAGRKGFLRLAAHEDVPIVPVVASGTHEQLVVLVRGDKIAQRLHAHDWARTEVLPIVLALPWGITSGFVPYLPLPAQTTLAFLPPMTWKAGVSIDQRYADVEHAMQCALDRLSRGRRWLLGSRGALLAGSEVA